MLTRVRLYLIADNYSLHTVFLSYGVGSFVIVGYDRVRKFNVPLIVHPDL